MSVGLDRELRHFRRERKTQDLRARIDSGKFEERRTVENMRLERYLQQWRSDKVEVTGATNGYWANLETPDWVIRSVDQEQRGFVTSYRNPISLTGVLSPDDIDAINQILRDDVLERERHDPTPQYEELRRTLDFDSYMTHGGSAVELAARRLMSLVKEAKSPVWVRVINPRVTDAENPYLAYTQNFNSLRPKELTG